MATTFTAQLDKWVAKAEKRVAAVVKQSAQALAEEIKKPAGAGGRMRVDTGFLRASGQMSLNGMPTGPVRPEAEEPGEYNWEQTTVITTLAKLKLGGSAFFGWTANYAKYRETYDGFLDAAVQNWPAIVAKVTRQIRARIK